MVSHYLVDGVSLVGILCAFVGILLTTNGAVYVREGYTTRILRGVGVAVVAYSASDIAAMHGPLPHSAATGLAAAIVGFVVGVLAPHVVKVGKPTYNQWRVAGLILACLGAACVSLHVVLLYYGIKVV